MRIAHLTSVHVPFDTRIFYKECCTLQEAGYQVHLVAAHERQETVSGIQIIPLPRYDRRYKRMLLGAWFVFRTARVLKAEVYHFHDPELLPVGVALKLTTRAKVIYDVHENYAQQLGSRGWMSSWLRPFLPPLVGLLEQISVKFFDAVITATPHIAALFPANKTVVVQNFPLLHLSTTEDNKNGRSPQKKPHLIYTGGWSNHRGVTQLVEALAYVKNNAVRLRVLGRRVDPFIQEAAQQTSAFDRVDDLGMLPYDQLYDQMKTAAIGMVCNQPGYDYEKSQPNKLFEYMSVGLPVIASNFPLWKELVEGSDCGLTVDSTDPDAIAKAVDSLIADPQRREEMGKNGRYAIKNKYNWQLEREKLIQLYKDLLAP